MALVVCFAVSGPLLTATHDMLHVSPLNTKKREKRVSAAQRDDDEKTSNNNNTRVLCPYYR